MKKYDADEFFGRKKKMTNAEKIAAMSAEEIMEFLPAFVEGDVAPCRYRPCDGHCGLCVRDWLRKEADDVDTR